MQDVTQIFKRVSDQPVLNVDDYPYAAQLYNPAPAKIGDEFVLLVSVVDHVTDEPGRDVGQTRVARSKDGVNFELSQDNFIPHDDSELPYSLFHHYIDNRVTPLEGFHYMISPVMLRGWESPVGLLGRTKDFTAGSYERLGVVTQPKNRGASLFPEKINGKYYKLDRPGGGVGSNGEIWMSSSPDLLHWGDYRPVLQPNYKFWNMNKMGPTPPIKTDQGWLEIVHGVFKPAGGAVYYVGAILLDLDEPWKVIGKTQSYLMKPELEWEKHGNCDNVIFPCGVLPDYEKDELRLYYGAADMNVGLAIGSIQQTVRACIEGS
ncbi:MAG: glycoside hydrolase family 130 protein [Planctomycetota bacterium]